MKEMIKKLQQYITTIKTVVISKLCGSYKKNITENDLIEKEKSYAWFLDNYPNDKDRLTAIQDYLTKRFNGEIKISRKTEVSLCNFMEEYYHKHYGFSITSQAMMIGPEFNKQHNKN